MRRKILIIDDHDDFASALEEVFSQIGHTITVVETREEALALGHLEGYDIVVTDLDGHPSSLQSNGEVCLPNVGPASAKLEHIRAFKLCAANFRRYDFDED